MGRYPSIVHQTQVCLWDMRAFGVSKHTDKLVNYGLPRRDRIYSGKTMTAYLKSCEQFVVWARKTYGCKLIDHARQYVGLYLQQRMDAGKSGWTIRLDACALAKLYQCRSTDFGVKLPTRHRADVKRYIGIEEKVEAFEKSYSNLAQVCKSCGLRVHELRELHVDDVYINPRGKCIIIVRKGKGGKPRYVIALDDSIMKFVEQAKQAGRVRVFSSIPSGAPVHWYRHIFAQRLYDMLARPVQDIPKEDRYVCRAERKGIVYDKKAMHVVSKALGHNRLGVVTWYIQ